MAIKIRIVSDFDKKGITEANKALNGLSDAAAVALAAVGAAVVGIGVASVREFAKFDAALVKSQAIMGDLTEALEKDMANAARDVAKVTTFSAEQAAESYFFLASAGLDAKSSIMALPQVAQFAQAGMFDMALATDLLTDAQSALGLTIRNDAVKNMENMVKVSDVLVRANTLANASVEQFSVALTTKAGAALRALGKDVEEGVAVLAAFADQGIKGEIAGTQLSIVLRDLTTKAINNKKAFDDMGIAVFDSNGEMNNLGDIIGNLEVALAGMSDETQKATLLQLGFSDKSLASLQALLGTSEAIKTYEKELRSASGFTENVATKQLDSFESQLKLLESAFIDVAIQIGEELTPYLQDLIPVLQDLLPEIGKKLADAVKQVDWEKLVTDVANFFTSIVENIDTITRVATAIGVFATGLVVYTTAAKLATIATGIFNSTLILSPIGLIATALAGLTYLLIQNKGAVGEATDNYNQLNSASAKADYETKNLADTYRESAYAADKYGIETDDLRDANLKLAGAADMVSGELTRFNNLKLDGVKNQIRGVNQEIIDMYHSGVAATAVFEGVLDPRTGKGIDFTLPSATATGTGTGTGTGGPSAFETARKRVQEAIKSSQKQIRDAEKTFLNAQISARENYANNIIRIEKDFASRFENIVKQSQDRLRSVFSSAVSTNIASLFEQDENKSVEGLVKSLSSKLAASRQLLANSAQLASEGFSQTFIEQIVSAGTETGNELASAILESTPETRAELKNLFTEIEREASSGMDSLASQIYQDQGLATDELKALYENTQLELTQALIDQQTALDTALTSANDAFVESVKRVKETLQEQLNDMEGQFGGMERTITQFMGKLDGLIAKYGELNAASNMAIAPLPAPSGGGAPAISFQPRPTSTPSKPTTTTTAPVVNINVKTDTTQSNAMVGKAIAKEVNKYTGGGGGLRGVKVVAL